MLDQKDAEVELLLDSLDEAGQVVGFLRVHARCRLIQQQQARPGGQSPRDFKPSLLAVGQADGQLIPQILQADHFQHLEGQCAQALFFLEVQVQGGGEQVAGAVQVRGDQHVFKYGLGLEQADVLEGAGQAQPGDPVGRGFDRLLEYPSVLARVQGLHFALRMVGYDQLVFIPHLPVGGFVYAGDAVEGRGFAGAVGADQRHDLAAVDMHAQVIDGDHAAKLHGDAFEFQHMISHGSVLPSSRGGRRGLSG